MKKLNSTTICMVVLCMVSLAVAQTGGRVVSWGKFAMGANMQGEYQAISLGSKHALGLRKDGSVAAWGLQTDRNSDYSPSCQVPEPNSGFTAVDAGGYHSLGLKTDGSIIVWGETGSGMDSVPTPNSGYTAISAGKYHSLALRADGSIAAWGVSGGYGTPPPGDNSDFVAISAGWEHNLALKSDGTVVAWGSNRYGQLDIPGTNGNFIAVAAGSTYSMALKDDGSIAIWGGQYANEVTLPSPNAGFVAIDAQGLGKVALKSDGSVYTWGSYDLQVPETLNNADFVAVAASYFCALGLKQDGTIVAWGQNYLGQMNIADNAGYLKVVPKIELYGGAFLALKSDGQLDAWGYEVGPDNHYNTVPEGTFTDIALGYGYGLAIKSDGTLQAWGVDNEGVLQVPTSTERFTGISAGRYHNIAIDADGRIYEWGLNGAGQTNIPGDGTGYTAVAAGDDYCVALRTDGSLALWGENVYGQASAPTTNSGFTAIACGAAHTLALRSEGSIEAWGRNYEGQCDVPAPNEGFVAIQAGGDVSMGMKSDGSIVVWGANTFEQQTLPVANGNFLSMATDGSTVLAVQNNAVHVRRSAASGGDGKTWATAYRYLQDGLAAASVGDVVLVTEGVYKPDEGAGMVNNDRSATFQLRNGVTIYGGFPDSGNPGFAERDPDEWSTVLSGDIDGNDAPDFVNHENNTLSILTGDGVGWSAVLDGFCIRGGYDNGNFYGGGGISNINGSSPTIRNCVFEENYGRSGGAIHNDTGSFMHIENCLFIHNLSYDSGAAIRSRLANDRIVDCQFTDNFATNYGGAVCGYYANQTISGCTFSQNGAGKYGGAVYNLSTNGDLLVSNCRFDQNETQLYSGGALYVGNGIDAVVSNCVFSGNQALGSGGGGAAICQSKGFLDVVGCTFFGNVAGSAGGALKFYSHTEFKMVNCVASGNSATYGGALYINGTPGEIINCSFGGNHATTRGGVLDLTSGSAVGMNNTVCWSNSAGSGSQISLLSGATLTSGNCVLQGGLAAVYSNGGTLIDGGGNLTSDPLYNDLDGIDNVQGSIDDDLSLSTNSPALDMGNNAAVPGDVTTDLVGMPRIVDWDKNGTTIVDIGAYEYYNNPDMDDDGLPDWWEQQIIDADPNDSINTFEDVDPNGDFDHDSLSNAGEYAAGTDPTDADSDDDTLSDGLEVLSYGSNPLSANSDGDRFNDAIEVAHHMDPNVDDSDVFDYVTGVISNSPEEMAAAGLYTKSAIRNVYIGAPLLQVDLAQQQVTIDAQLEWSDSLSNGTWQAYGLGSPDWTRTDQGWIHHAVGDHCFYRIFMDEQPAE